MAFLVVDAAIGEDLSRDDWRDAGVEVVFPFEAACERFRGVDLEVGLAVAEDVDGIIRRGMTTVQLGEDDW